MYLPTISGLSPKYTAATLSDSSQVARPLNASGEFWNYILGKSFGPVSRLLPLSPIAEVIKHAPKEHPIIVRVLAWAYIAGGGLFVVPVVLSIVYAMIGCPLSETHTGELEKRGRK